MKWIMRKMVQKDAGDIIGDIVPLLLAAIAMAVLVVGVSNLSVMIDRKNRVEQIARKYILEMEVKGYLTGEDQAALLEDLSKAGVTDVDLDGTTVSMVSYGSVITLAIRGNLTGSRFWMTSGFGAGEAKKTVPISICKVSTAKH